MISSDSSQQWFVFRATYGREGKAREIIAREGVQVYMPTMRVKVMVAGVPRTVQKPLVPNMLFVWCTQAQADTFIKEHPDLPKFLRYYYNHVVVNPDGTNPPLVVPDKEMENFIRLTSVDSDHIKVVDPSQCRYRSGDRVRVIKGAFEGVEGRVARVTGQQRVVITLEGLCTVATAYIPSAFLETIG